MSINYSKYFSAEDYYTKFVIPMDPKKFKIVKGKMLCPLHNDHDPSLGIMRKKDGSEMCHCFGCNFYGDIVRLHQSIRKKYFGKYLTPIDSLKELCSMFNVNYNNLPLDDSSLIEDRDTRQEQELLKSMDTFDIGDFKHLLREGKRQKRGVGYFNALLMTMVSTVKDER